MLLLAMGGPGGGGGNVEFVDLPDSECIFTMSFNAEAGHNYKIKADHDSEGQPELSIVEFAIVEKICDEPSEDDIGPPLCASKRLYGDEVARVPCKKIVKKIGSLSF